MSTLAEAREAYVAALSAYPALTAMRVTVSTHGGSFDLDQLQKYSKSTPAAVLSLLSFELDGSEGYKRCEARWGVVCFAQHTGKDASAAEIAQAVCDCLLSDFVGLDTEHRILEAAARNLFGVPTDFKGVAMWAVEFASDFELTSCDAADDSELTDFTGVDTVWDVAPRDNEAPLGEIPEAVDNIQLVG